MEIPHHLLLMQALNIMILINFGLPEVFLANFVFCVGGAGFEREGGRYVIHE